MDLVKQLRRARGRGVTLVALTTPDQPAAATLVVQAANGSGDPVIAWDCVRGPQGLNAAGERAVTALLDGLDASAATDFPGFSTLLDRDLPMKVPAEDGQVEARGGFIVAFNGHRLVDAEPGRDFRSVQAIANLRDQLGRAPATPEGEPRRLGSILILLCPSWSSPAELGSDVLVLDDPLPTEAEREELVRAQVVRATASGAEVADVESAVASGVRMTRGLSRYVLQQTLLLSLEKTGLDEAALRSRFVAAVNNTPGLSFEPDPMPMERIGGLDNFKAMARAIAGSRRKPKAVVWLDEVEKALAGASGPVGDSSGVSQNVLGSILTWMEDHEATGLIAEGPPGAGKSMSAKALGGVLGVPTIRLDLGALKGSLVGQSEANTRAALKALEALAGDTYWIATCNSDMAIPPELRRRFKQGIWFFDLPTAAERDQIWRLYEARFELAGPRPNDEGWTGAEIRSCCESAWALNVTQREAAQWIVPVARSAAETIDALRRKADGRFISASYPGAYRYQEVKAQAPEVVSAAPALSFED